MMVEVEMRLWLLWVAFKNLLFLVVEQVLQEELVEEPSEDLTWNYIWDLFEDRIFCGGPRRI